MVAGQSEFSFGFVSAPEMIEKTLNRGAGLGSAGPINLRGNKDSWRTSFAADIADFGAFREILRSHLLLQCNRYVKNLLTFYGNKATVCPSPLLSALIGGCMESGRDLTAGGANYHIFSPLLIGVSTAADSLHVIEKLAYRDKAFSLTELTTCLATDWGHRLLDVAGGKVPAFGPYAAAERISEIRALALAEPKFGNGVEEVDRWAWWLLDSFADCLIEAVNDPLHEPGFRQLRERFGKDGDFDFHIAPGVGTFEQYVGMGGFYGASADGRRSGGALGSDLSPAPVPGDLPPIGADGRHARSYGLADSLRSYHNAAMQRFGDGAPVDYNIREDMPRDELTAMLRAFADGQGGSICTFTVADPETLAAAQRDPEAHNLVRVRMGGWTEFFITLFPDHQEQHKRRPLYA
jgi:pyruvate-formate lyase